MSSEQNKTIVRRLLEEPWKGDLRIVDELIDRNYVGRQDEGDDGRDQRERHGHAQRRGPPGPSPRRGNREAGTGAPASERRGRQARGEEPERGRHARTEVTAHRVHVRLDGKHDVVAADHQRIREVGRAQKEDSGRRRRERPPQLGEGDPREDREPAGAEALGRVFLVAVRGREGLAEDQGREGQEREDL